MQVRFSHLFWLMSSEYHPRFPGQVFEKIEFSMNVDFCTPGFACRAFFCLFVSLFASF